MSQPSTLAFPEPGEVIAGKYRIDRLLSDKGGMGLLVVGKQVLLGVPVAIKFLRPAPADPSRASPTERFINEARLLAQLNNEHIVRVLDVALLPNGIPRSRSRSRCSSTEVRGSACVPRPAFSGTRCRTSGSSPSWR